MPEFRTPVGERSFTTLGRHRELAIKHGFTPGAKVQYSKIYHGNAKGEDVFRTGTVIAWYPYIFVVEWSNGYLESFRYQQIFEKELRVIKGGKKW